MEDFDNVESFNPQAQVIEKIKDEVALVRTETTYQTAITVAKPRDLRLVREKALVESKIGKNHMWYTWQVRNKKTGKKEWIPAKGTIGLAQALLRSFGNCVTNTTIEERNGYWIFKSVFIDLENGVTTTRELQSKIPVGKNDNYDIERWRNMQFQVAQSKNQRDVILNGTPRWLQAECIEAAMEASKVESKEAQAALKKGIDFFKQYDISEKEICIFFGKIGLPEFTLDDINKMRNLGVQLKNGDIKPHEIKDQAKDIFDYNKAREGDTDNAKPNKQEEQKPPKKTPPKRPTKPKPELKPEIKPQKKETSQDAIIDPTPKDPFADIPEPETAEEAAQLGMLAIHQAQIDNYKTKAPLVYEAACDSLFIDSKKIPQTADACEILLEKIRELGKSSKR